MAKKKPTYKELVKEISVLETKITGNAMNYEEECIVHQKEVGKLQNQLENREREIQYAKNKLKLHKEDEVSLKNNIEKLKLAHAWSKGYIATLISEHKDRAEGCSHYWEPNS